MSGRGDAPKAPASSGASDVMRELPRTTAGGPGRMASTAPQTPHAHGSPSPAGIPGQSPPPQDPPQPTNQPSPDPRTPQNHRGTIESGGPSGGGQGVESGGACGEGDGRGAAAGVAAAAAADLSLSSVTDKDEEDAQGDEEGGAGGGGSGEGKQEDRRIVLARQKAMKGKHGGDGDEEYTPGEDDLAEHQELAIEEKEQGEQEDGVPAAAAAAGGASVVPAAAAAAGMTATKKRYSRSIFARLRQSHPDVQLTFTPIPHQTPDQDAVTVTMGPFTDSNGEAFYVPEVVTRSARKRKSLMGWYFNTLCQKAKRAIEDPPDHHDYFDEDEDGTRVFVQRRVKPKAKAKANNVRRRAPAVAEEMGDGEQQQVDEHAMAAAAANGPPFPWHPMWPFDHPPPPFWPPPPYFYDHGGIAVEGPPLPPGVTTGHTSNQCSSPGELGCTAASPSPCAPATTSCRPHGSPAGCRRPHNPCVGC
ncbi:unnamed protein product [Vitrella brassicaformis CCMP3155]|uniref:Uncharacterized protein n=1 Tax=Vitrella brassicaformis (strain CCMP3155) TaxID=1169540 RepID=A0A0G4ESB9_VITBC|nr:unnamed protein product [Vitrella brassicaformis CCMP3155]|eukprot:CEM00765.1 unnamed protein product [Vitrella brassicaformis CCMP3155]